MSRFRCYLVPTLLLAPVIFICGKLVFTEILVEIHSAVPALPTPSRHYERGWPLVFAHNSTEGSGLVTLSKQEFSIWPLLADVIIALAILTMFGAWLKRRLNHEQPWRFSLRILLFAVLLIAALCGWLMQAYRSWQREQAAIGAVHTVFGDTGMLSDAYRGPQWLRRFVYWDGIPALGATNSPYLALLNTKEPLTMFDRVTRFETPVLDFATETGMSHHITAQQLNDLTLAFADMPYLRTVHLEQNLPSEPDQFEQWNYVDRVECHAMKLDRQLLQCLACIPHLRELSLDECGIFGSATLEPLVNCRELKRLDLSFDETVLDDAVEVLCKLSSLEELRLNTTLISDTGARRLLALPNLKRIAVPPNTSQATRDEFKDKIIDWTTTGDSEE